MRRSAAARRQTRLKTSVPLVPPKPKLFFTRVLDLHLARRVGAVVQVALGILVEDVDRRRRDLVLHRQHREHRLDAAGAAEQVAGHRLGRVDDQLLRVVAEGELDRVGLVHVAQRRRGAVRVEVLDLVGVDAGVAQRGHHRALRAVDVRRGHVVGVGAHAEADQLGIDLRAAPLRVLVLLEHQHAGAFAEHEAVAVLVPGTRGGRRIVVARRQRARRGEAADAERRDRRFGAAGDHHVGVAVLDQPAGLADAVQAGGAGGDDRQVRAPGSRT